MLRESLTDKRSQARTDMRVGLQEQYACFECPGIGTAGARVFEWKRCAHTADASHAPGCPVTVIYRRQLDSAFHTQSPGQITRDLGIVPAIATRDAVIPGIDYASADTALLRIRKSEKAVSDAA